MKLQDFLVLVEKNPYTGTTKQVVTLSKGIHKASMQLDGKTLREYRDLHTDITPPIFSKLKVIGKVLSALDPTELKDVQKVLPDAYTTIQVLCGLKPKELVTAARTKGINKKTSIRAAKNYVRTIRHPSLAGEITRQDHQEPVMTIYQEKDAPLDPDALTQLQEALQKICEQYGVEARSPQNTNISALRKQDRADREVFWRNALEKELTHDWFKESSKEVRKQFNLRTIDELYNTPLRQFTGFLVRACGGRTFFWERFGRAYVCKIQMEQEKTDDRTHRSNYKRRLEQVFADDAKGGTDLATWNIRMMKGSGFMP